MLPLYAVSVNAVHTTESCPTVVENNTFNILHSKQPGYIYFSCMAV